MHCVRSYACTVSVQEVHRLLSVLAPFLLHLSHLFSDWQPLANKRLVMCHHCTEQHARDTLSFSCIHFKRPERIKYMWCCNPSHLNQMDLLLSERIHCPKCKVAANYNKHGQACKATAAWRAAVERAKHMVDTVAAVEHTRACHVCKGGRCVLVHIILKHEQGLMHLWHTFLPCKHLDFPLRACHINCLVNKHLNCLKTISCIKKKKDHSLILAKLNEPIW